MVNITSKQLYEIRHRSSYDFAIGIDTGVHTGYAEWDCKEKKFKNIKTMKIHEAIFHVREKIIAWKRRGVKFVIRVEDARQRKWYDDKYDKFGKKINRQQGAGSVKRDSSIWDDFLNDEKVNYEMVAPKNNSTKKTGDEFSAITNYVGRTSEHGRDAAMLVIGY